MHSLNQISKSVPLNKRIVIAFTIQTLVIAIIVYSSTLFTIRFVEKTLLHNHLTSYLDAYVEEINSGKKPLTPADTHVYKRGVDKIPEYVQNFEPGSHELELEFSAYHVVTKEYDQSTYVLIQDQSEFEMAEEAMLDLVVFFLIFFVLISFLFSITLARKIIQPIVDLSNDIDKLSSADVNPVKPVYANDEVGKFIDIIFNYISRLSSYLQREKWITSDISHELRTPMMVISSSLDVLQQEENIPEQKQMLYQNMSDSAKNINELINTFLLLARETPKNKTTILPEIDIRKVTEHTIQQLTPYAEEKELLVKITGENVIKTRINEKFFSIVISNIIKNSIFNTQDGSINISLKKNSVKIDDTGCGLPANIKHFINTDTDVYPTKNNNRLGIGLSIVKRVCEHEGWSLQCSDNEQQGSSFLITFKK